MVYERPPDSFMPINPLFGKFTVDLVGSISLVPVIEGIIFSGQYFGEFRGVVSWKWLTPFFGVKFLRGKGKILDIILSFISYG